MAYKKAHTPAPTRKAGGSPRGPGAGAGWSRWRLAGLGAEAPQCGWPRLWGAAGGQGSDSPGAQPVGGHRPQAFSRAGKFYHKRPGGEFFTFCGPEVTPRNLRLELVRHSHLECETFLVCRGHRTDHGLHLATSVPDRAEQGPDTQNCLEREPGPAGPEGSPRDGAPRQLSVARGDV